MSCFFLLLVSGSMKHMRLCLLFAVQPSGRAHRTPVLLGCFDLPRTSQGGSCWLPHVPCASCCSLAKGLPNCVFQGSHMHACKKVSCTCRLK